MVDWFRISRCFVFLVPLTVAVATTATLFPFVVGKYVFFRTAVDLALISFLLGLLVQDASWIMWRRLSGVLHKPLVTAVSVFVGVFLLACLLGVNPSFSFWSNFERGEGGLQLLHLWLFFVLLATLFPDERDWKCLFGWTMAGGVLSATYGLLAGWGVDGFVGPRFGEARFRFQASIGNPAYVAAVSLFLIAYVAYLLHDVWRQKKIFSAWGILLAVLGLVFLAMFFAAATRGAFIGLVAAFVAFAGYFAFVQRAWRKRLIGGVMAALLLVGTSVHFKDSPFVKSIPGSRIFAISFSANTLKDRALMWKIAWDGFEERPLLGWGPENFGNVFAHDFDPAYFKPAKGFGRWFDRAHSIYFDYLAEIGALGLLSFLAVFIVLYWQIFRAGRTGQVKEPGTDHPARHVSAAASEPSLFVGAFLCAVPVAYLVQGIVLFDVLVIYLNLFLFLAFATYKLHEPIPQLLAPQQTDLRPVSKTVFIAVLLVLAALSIWFGAILPWRKARSYVRAVESLSTAKSMEEFEAVLNQSLSLASPIGQEEVVRLLGGIVMDSVITADSLEPVSRAQVLFIEPHLFHNDAFHLLLGGNFYNVLWRKYQRDEDFVKAEAYYRAALALGPKLPPALYCLFDMYCVYGDAGKAQEIGKIIGQYWPHVSS